MNTLSVIGMTFRCINLPEDRYKTLVLTDGETCCIVQFKEVSKPQKARLHVLKS